MEGRAGRWYSYLIMAYAGLLTFTETQPTICQQPALSENSFVVPLLSSVNLTCPGCEGSVSWFRHSQRVPRRPHSKTDSGRLVLTAVKYKDEDNYTCYRDGVPVCTVELLVRGELEKPEILCYLRHPTHNITCEWKPTRRLHPLTRVILIAWRIRGSPSTSACAYVNSSKKFTCSSLYYEGDSERHTLSMCVTSPTGSQYSNTVEKSIKELLQPDPPVNVQVAAMENQPRRLKVSWKPTELWKRNRYYKLEYEVQYRVDNSQHVSNGTTMKTSFFIEDALMRRRHIVRVRAKEEFNKVWSSWSKEAVGTPWSDEEAEPSTTLTSSECDPANSSEEEEPQYNDKKLIPIPNPRYTLLMAGVSLGLVVLLFIGILMRHHEMKLLRLKGGLLRTLFQSSPQVTGTQPLSSESLLMSPCSSPTSVTVSAPTLPDAD